MNESPVKKLNFDANGKENAPADTDLKPAKVDADKPAEDAAKVAPGLKEIEAKEPLLQENPHRFVLFPIKYHEVSTRHA
jgi:ribonucleoside-diphosphate reductase subunit M2